MSKVYLAWWCNNEEYEDYSEALVGVYSTREKAVKAIERDGYSKEDVPSWWNENSPTERWFMCVGEEHHSMWVEEREVL